MKKYIVFVLLMIIGLSFGYAHEGNQPHYVNLTDASMLDNPDDYYEYMIVKGDYLWMLSERFYDDPWKWPKIYKANSYIVDPDWIYPNNWLVIPEVYNDDSDGWIYGVPPVKTIVNTELTKLVSRDADGNILLDADGNPVVYGGYGIDVDGDGVIDGYDTNGDGKIDVVAGAALTLDKFNTTKAESTALVSRDAEGNILYDENGNPVIYNGYGIDIDGDGIIDGYDTNGNGEIDVLAGAALTLDKFNTTKAESTALVSRDAEGNILYDENGNPIIYNGYGIDIDGDGVIDGYDTNGDGIIDIAAGDALTLSEYKTTKAAAEEKADRNYCDAPSWSLGLHAGYPLGDVPEEFDKVNLGLILGTPLGFHKGPFNVGLGAGVFTYDFEKFYPGVGVLANLCLNDLINLNIPLLFKISGIGGYIFGEGFGLGAIGSASVPLGNTPLSLGVYGALGQYYPEEGTQNWINAGGVINYSF